MKYRFLCTTAIAVATTLSPVCAFAQDAAQLAVADSGDEGQVVVVTGSYRRSLEKAVDIKRKTTGFSDSIVATDVVDFPEQNLAEALQRMPGVTIERNKGLGTRVMVRGLPAEFTHVSINDLATASGSGGRDVEFDMFASEIIQQVTVHKSPTAADEEGGIAGSVDITTARPFDYKGRKLVAAFEGAHNSISGETDPRMSFLASNTWGDWGALVSFATTKRTNRTDANSGINFRPAFRFLEASGARGTQAADVLARDAGVVVKSRTDRNETGRIIFQDKVGDRVYLNEQDKWGATVALQYKPSSDFNLAFDAMVGSYDSTEDEYDIAAYSASSRSTFETIHAYDKTTLADYGMVVLRDVSYTATQHEFLSKERINETDYAQFGGELNWRGDGWKLRALAGYSGAEKTSDYANLKHVAYAPSRTRWTDKGGETVKSANPASIDMYNASSKYLFEAYETNLESVTDDKAAAQVDYTRFFGLSSFPALQTLQFGLRYTDKSKERQYGALNIQGPTAGSTAWLNTRTLANSELQWIGDIVPGGDYTVSDLDWQQVSNDYARRTFRYAGFYTPFDVSQYYKVDEKVTTVYAMADFAFDLGSVPVAINAGARYVDTTVNSAGYHQVQNPNGTTGYTPAPVSKEGTYQKLLPSLNFTADLMDNLVLRGAASETLMRPALTDLAYKRTASWNSFRFTDGNPDLKPTYARQWEIGIEKYLPEGGLLAASYFSKTIEGVVRSTLTGTVPNVTKYNANGTIDGVYEFDVYQPVNAEGSYDVSGLELVAVVPFGLLHERLQGFGINANYTLLDSSLTGSSTLGIPTAPIGLADNTYNITLYYENDRFDARASYNYKDKYVEGIGYEMYPIYRDGYGQLDISLSYRLSDRAQVSLKGINMTDAVTTGYTMDPSFPTMYELSGRRISVGLRFDF
ncbi:tonB-dependent receptor family protein [Asticcacaulis biprosthecium C19]|uniref:TonB-dependent receptor family protein n=1 Tax=Asticcacaulis biprosthecium C19 TaxID=715226 RepID=F4QIG3_9CAUL|nr:TonB-dependent receptor [Asticcacaulis biprosthecium]EGF92952.1 tonB-dependent receptor family protein [Asticcacaulis biprosthecium C19]